VVVAVVVVVVIIDAIVCLSRQRLMLPRMLLLTLTPSSRSPQDSLSVANLDVSWERARDRDVLRGKER